MHFARRRERKGSFGAIPHNDANLQSRLDTRVGMPGGSSCAKSALRAPLIVGRISSQEESV
jgi:hypothetical protein